MNNIINHKHTITRTACTHTHTNLR